MLHFSDGIDIDPSGPIRKVCLADGWYVVGNGMSIPAKDEQEAFSLVDQYSYKKPAFPQ